ncbi:MAG TPA: aconitase family protein, partial [Steroidobacteraceae bacterium]|nr:aconitase family protein [Steroidobacteraceae bacterium]
MANMSPEFGSTCAIFPIDEETTRYLALTGRSDAQIALVESYARTQGLWRTAGMRESEYTDVLELDLVTVEPSLAGPRRPQDRVPLRTSKAAYRASVAKLVDERRTTNTSATGRAEVVLDGARHTLGDGAVLIAAITSCTNTSNPAVLVGAGLLARKARALGLSAQPWVKTSLAPGSRVVTDYLRKAGLLAELEGIGFYVVGYGCTTCIAAETPILLANGTTRRIEQMPSAGGAVLFGPTADGRLGMAVQAEMMTQGTRECVSLVLQDGRTLVCTPDHQVLCTDGRWVRADQLVLGRDRVVVGLEGPLDQRGPDEADYELVAGELRFTMDSEHERLRTLAFARLLGHLLSDGSISLAGQGRMNVGQALDREVVLHDIELLTGKRPVANRYDERKWTIVLPRELTSAALALPGVRPGQRIHQAATLPAFVLEARCPIAVLREFLAGLFGADGHAPTLHRWGESEREATLEPPAYSQSATPEHVDHLRQVMHDLIRLLARCGVRTRGASIREYATRRSVSSYPSARDGIPRIELRLELPDGLSFIERVGFRYCADKALRASAAAVYWRTVDTINRQRLWMADRLEELHKWRYDLSFSRSRCMAAAELTEQETPVFPHYSLLEGLDRFARLPKPTDRRFRPLHRRSCDFPTPAELLEQMGVRSWFAS